MARFLIVGIPDGTLQESEQTLQKALVLSPDNIFALLELARTDLLMGKKNEAIGYLKRSQNSEPAWYKARRLKQKSEQLLQTLVP